MHSSYICELTESNLLVAGISNIWLLVINCLYIIYEFLQYQLNVFFSRKCSKIPALNNSVPCGFSYK